MGRKRSAQAATSFLVRTPKVKREEEFIHPFLKKLPEDDNLWAREWAAISCCEWPRLKPLLMVFGAGDVKESDQPATRAGTLIRCTRFSAFLFVPFWSHIGTSRFRIESDVR